MKFYVGTYTHLGGPGVVACELEDETLRLVAKADTDLTDPIYIILTKDQKTILVTTATPSDGEAGESLATVDVSGDVPKLTSIHSTAGLSSCHVTLSPDERFAYVASYSSGSLSVFPFENGVVGKRIQDIRHEGHSVNPQRQEMAHAHFVAFNPDDGRLYCCDLGLDAVMIYEQDAKTGLLTLYDRVSVPEGMGPRHLAFRENMMYVANELGGAVSVFRRRDTFTGQTWEYVETVSTLPDGAGSEGAVAAIRLDESRLFVSNRENDSISEFSYMPGGALRLERTFSVFGSFPRDFYLLPGRQILVANQNSGDVRLLGLDPIELPPDEVENKSVLGGPFSGLFDLKKTQQWLKPILGERPDLGVQGGVYQIGEELSIPGAVCVCPVL